MTACEEAVAKMKADIHAKSKLRQEELSRWVSHVCIIDTCTGVESWIALAILQNESNSTEWGQILLLICSFIINILQ